VIRYLYADQLDQLPDLKTAMFLDRAQQFQARLGWQVQVDVNGFETDEYDAMNPLYVIWQLPDGTHGGSMRFLPTTGPVMVNDHFGDLTDGVQITSPLIWEVTRFCVSPKVKVTGRVSAALMLAGAELGQGFHLNHAVGVFDARMVRIYRALGWAPDITGTRGDGPDAISVGLWDFQAPPFDKLCARAGLCREVSQNWFSRAFQI
jgi:acyl homoserine lactone synthase